ncbi:PREDICTED: aspartyl protease family protein 1-like [Nicotiana attenuata]|uniref:Aspartyl protease family protein 1 n=1 Tax=Nicotiana attenuata TaxID=49451 RepID=A0A1J6IGL7_NICAT|nr:PREDICTED: aspartyl protease family protein 1-like [Nicotiana attenuata]OIT03794.1 aspartyl protease family protein 1 [Nicotiana attenuata]
MANSYTSFNFFLAPIIFLAILGLQLQSSDGFGTFGFDIHHRYSDPVKGILDLHGLPEKGSVEYYSAWTQRDRFIKGRRLADTTNPTPLSFSGGNETFRLSSLGFLHYANVTVGTPGLSFLVALDTGSDLFWLPCDCSNCVRALETRSGRRINLNIYSPNTSSTGQIVPCNGTLCGQRRRCLSSQNACAYGVAYLSNNTSSSGVLVEDILHLETDNAQQKSVEAPIALGCGIRQTGAFLSGAAPNGLFGLGLESISVPSMLASKGLAANSFSMCFGPDGIGRIVFGDKGSPAQGETPLNLDQLHPTYNISLTGITVGNKITDVDFTAIFDSGTSFTYLNNPAYKVVTENFDSQAKQPRIQPDGEIPFAYCYGLSANQTTYEVPDVNLTMKGGNQFFLFDPIILLSLQDGSGAYCLAVVKSGDVNIIGQNFMTGYRVVFDREKMVLGWKPSDCYDSRESNNKSTTLPVNKRNSTEAPSPASVVPEATKGNGSGNEPATSFPSAPSTRPAANHAPTLFNSYICQLMMAVFSFFSYYLIIISS